MIDVKICGLSTPETIDAAIRHGASHVGFVFYARSPRAVSFDRVRSLAPVAVNAARVGVFVDPSDEEVEIATEAGRLDALQVHHVDARRCNEIANRVGRPVWGVAQIKTREDLAQVHRFEGSCQRILFDAKTPAGTLPGGMGVRFDWRLLAGFDHRAPWALSGGLNEDNLAEAVGLTGARMVDISSGVESAPGAKDVDKIAAFLRAAHSL